MPRTTWQDVYLVGQNLPSCNTNHDPVRTTNGDIKRCYPHLPERISIFALVSQACEARQVRCLLSKL
jgi:hypothetical protein